jgi:hypothetical protein
MFGHKIAFRSRVLALIGAGVAVLCAGVVFGASRTGWAPATIVSINADRVQLKESDGTTVTAVFMASSVLLANGAPTLSLSSFSAGEPVMVRLRESSKDGGLPRVEMISDKQTAAALTFFRKAPLGGTITATMPGWLVVKTDQAGLVPVELASATLYRQRGGVVARCPFAVGDHVVIQTRASTTGSLTAKTISDSQSGGELGLPLLPASIVRGSVVAVDPADHTITLVTKEAVRITLSDVPGVTTIREGHEQGSLAAIKPGMVMIAHLTGGKDAGGFVAKSISATAAP